MKAEFLNANSFHSVDVFDLEAKDDSGKPRLSLVSPYLIEAVGTVRTYGTEKYGDSENWREVDTERYKDALMRHWVEYMKNPLSVDSESTRGDRYAE